MMANSSVSRGAPSAARNLFLLSTVALLAACTVSKPHRAPVEDRSVQPATPAAPAPSADSRPAATAAEPARAGQYTVRPGDTLIRIALDLGLGWRDLARWNGLDNPNLIEVGQVLRTVPPADPATRPVQQAKVDSKPLDAKPADPKAMEARPVESRAAASAPAPTAPPVVAAAPADGEISWAWPAQGSLVASFDEQRNKGLAIAGKAGEPVLAAADGRVMYAGSGLRGYGNMVIIKHNDTFLSAYAHNQSLLVKEDQVVRKGQPIAEMGSTDADQVKLHFEIRRKGKPVDPARLLPPR